MLLYRVESFQQRICATGDIDRSELPGIIHRQTGIDLIFVPDGKQIENIDLESRFRNRLDILLAGIRLIQETHASAHTNIGQHMSAVKIYNIFGRQFGEIFSERIAQIVL